MRTVLDALECFVAVDAGEDGLTASLGVLIEFGLFQRFLAVITNERWHTLLCSVNELIILKLSSIDQ